MTYVDYKQLSPMQKFTYKLKKFFTSIPKAIGSFFKTIGLGIAHFQKLRHDLCQR